MEYKEGHLDWTSGHFSSLSDNLHHNVQQQAIGLKSYPPSSSVCQSSSGISSNHGSLNTLQISVIALKDRCIKQQRKIDLLEEENSRLYYALGVSDLPYKDDLSRNNMLSSSVPDDHLEALNRLQEANFFLRQRNLELNQKIFNKSDTSVKSKSHNLGNMKYEDPSSKPDIIINKNKSTSKTNTKNTISINGAVVESEIEEDEIEDHVNQEATDILGKESEKSLNRIQLTEQNMQELKEQLLSQQKLMLHAVKSISDSLSHKSPNQNIPTEINKSLKLSPLINSSCTASDENNGLEDEHAFKEMRNVKEMITKQSNQRLCPMCEANFPNDQILQEDFEAHVLGHFSYEDEAETLTNYDMVIDAQRSLDGDF